jgi:two-component system sensor histidine kinase/response regulator
MENFQDTNTPRHQHSNAPAIPMTANILVVDDKPDNLRLLIEILSKSGYEVRPASDGEFALQSAWSSPPDLILLDIKMPNMNGYAVCEQLKADECTRDIPVIFISALNEVVDKVKGFALGGVDYITKPFQAEEVLARVQTHLTLRDLQKSLQEEITWRKHAEEELRELNHQLQEANASKDKFFSIIAHDLRNPFTSLIGLTEAIIEDFDLYGKDKIKAMISQLHTSSKTVYTLLTNLLEWSRLERGLIKCVPEDISIADIAEQNIYLLRTRIEHKQITPRNLIPKGTRAYADENMVNTIMRNLLSNALKFTESGGTIDVSLPHRNKNVVEIAVSDTGVGINQENMEKLFRIDAKFTTTGTDGEQGTGLGLVLCKELVEKNGGTIRVESEVGKGTMFVFTLPVMPTK